MRAESGNYEHAASQFLLALRGGRSHRALARRLGYAANPITDWEHGRRYPTADEALRVAKTVGVHVTVAFERFLPLQPECRCRSPGAPALRHRAECHWTSALVPVAAIPLSASTEGLRFT